ncbi:serine acetyltransferase [Sphingomonas humi]|uniref:serine acetyltransferase n=1 Tax=Sphingomonas humi TaxID=335630 RepID=UPI0031CFE346
MTPPDWSRERKRSLFEWAPYKSLLGAIRAYQASRDRSGPIAFLRWTSAFFRWRFWSVVSGASIPLRTRIGGGLQIPHCQGVAINVASRIGCNCDIFQGVTIGEYRGQAPTIGDGVQIGPGATILGEVTIGDGARIGPMALVMSDVPAGGAAYAPRAEIRGP